MLLLVSGMLVVMREFGQRQAEPVLLTDVGHHTYRKQTARERGRLQWHAIHTKGLGYLRRKRKTGWKEESNMFSPNEKMLVQALGASSSKEQAALLKAFKFQGQDKLYAFMAEQTEIMNALEQQIKEML
jgi:hypothetical protein